MNAVEFAILLKDKASTTIDKIGKEFGGLKSRADKLSTSMGNIGRNLKSAFMSLPGSQFLMNPFVAIGAGTAYITKLGIENEKATVSFEVLLQSADKAKILLGEINKFADTTPYQKMGLRDAAKMMLGFGIAQEKIMPNLRMIGDISMGDANKMNQMTLAYSQMSSAGKLMGQDLLQMINGGFNPLNEISKMTGKSMGQLRKEMEKGQISSKMVEAAFLHATSAGGMFYGMTERMGKTVGGRISTIIDSFKNKLLELYKVIEPVLVPALSMVLSVLGALDNPIALLVKGVTSVIGLLKQGNPLIWGAVSAFTAYYAILTLVALETKYLAWYNGVSTAAMIVNILATQGLTAAWVALDAAMTANPIMMIVVGIGALVSAFVWAYQKVAWFRGGIMAAWEALKGFGDIVVNFVVDSLGGMLKGIVGVGKALWQLITGDMKGAMKTGQQAINDLLMVDASNKAIARAKQTGKNMGAAYQQGVSEVEAKKAKDSKIIPGTNVAYGTTGGEGTTGGTTTGGATTVATGGTRNTSINIHLGKMVENLIYQGGVSESAKDVEKKFEEIMYRVLFAAQSAS